MSIEQIGQKVGSYNCSNIVITGGEPMANDNLAGLVGHLKKPGIHITIETSGRHYRDDIACDLMSISPKLANAGDNPTESQTVNKLISRYNYQLKFVIEARSDLAQVQAMVEALDDVERGKILLMPQCRSRDEYLARSSLVAEMCLETGYTFGQRLHVLLWNGLAGK